MTQVGLPMPCQVTPWNPSTAHDVAAAGHVPKTDLTTPMPRPAWSSPWIAVASGC